MARVLPDVAGLDKEFDYLVPEAMADRLEVGSLVRVALHGRRVGGWVTALGVEATPGVTLRPLAKVTGLGPDAALVDLAGWAAWRWAGRRRALLRTASPPTAVAGLPAARLGGRVVTAAPAADGADAADDVVRQLAATALGHQRAVLRLPPAVDPTSVAEVAAGLGPTLVVAPSVAMARAVAVALRRSGQAVALHPGEWARGVRGATVVGARAAAWARMDLLAAVVLLDEHDEALQEERNPTWHAREVVAERAERARVPCVVVSPCPSLEALAWGDLLTLPRRDERAGWPVVEVVDMGREDRQRDGPWSPALVRLLRSGARVACVLNRTGRATLLACARCRTLARCEVCEAAVAQPSPELLACRRCGATRPLVCRACGGTRMAARRRGVARAREELEALAGEPVVEVTSSGDDVPAASRLYVGTEAVLHRVAELDAVAFLDLDQELLAPRFRAAEQALALLARAARKVGGRSAGGRLLVQTELPHHEVLDAVLHADPGRLARTELARRQALRFPPASAVALVSGPGAAEHVASLAPATGVEVLGPDDGRWMVRAPDHAVLADVLATARRPSARVRVEVDPARV